jgi:hypothetical protein
MAASKLGQTQDIISKGGTRPRFQNVVAHSVGLSDLLQLLSCGLTILVQGRTQCSPSQHLDAAVRRGYVLSHNEAMLLKQEVAACLGLEATELVAAWQVPLIVSHAGRDRAQLRLAEEAEIPVRVSMGFLVKQIGPVARERRSFVHELTWMWR